jgi:hypothetical protein
MKRIATPVILVILVSGFVLANSSPADTLTKEQVEVVQKISTQYESVQLFMKPLFWILSLVAAVAVGFGINWLWFRSQIEEKVVGHLSKKLDVKKEALVGALKNLSQEYSYRQKDIMIVSESKGTVFALKTFLTDRDFKLPKFLDIGEFEAEKDKGGYDLVLYNFLNQDLDVVQKKFGDQLLTLFGKSKVIVLGNGRMDDKYKKTMGNYLSFSNGLDTLESRILGAYKQPV